MRMRCQLSSIWTEAESAGGIKFELAILNRSSTLSKLLNGTLDVASTLPYPELASYALNF